MATSTVFVRCQNCGKIHLWNGSNNKCTCGVELVEVRWVS